MTSGTRRRNARSDSFFSRASRAADWGDAGSSRTPRDHPRGQEPLPRHGTMAQCLRGWSLGVRLDPASPQSAALDALLKNESDLAFRRRVPLVIRYLDPQTGDRVLDCGCGMGFTLRVIDRVF